MCCVHSVVVFWLLLPSGQPSAVSVCLPWAVFDPGQSVGSCNQVCFGQLAKRSQIQFPAEPKLCSTVVSRFGACTSRVFMQVFWGRGLLPKLSGTPALVQEHLQSAGGRGCTQAAQASAVGAVLPLVCRC